MMPECKICKIQMRVSKTTSGLKFICDNYHKCGQSSSYEKWIKKVEESKEI